MLDMGLFSNLNSPTHRGHYLDRLYTNRDIYSGVKAITSNIKTEHSAIIANCDKSAITDFGKQRRQVQCRLHSNGQVASFLDTVKSFSFSCMLTSCNNVQDAFNSFYYDMHYLLNKFFPVSNVTITSRDPPFMTPQIKLLLRRKNRLMHAGKIEMAQNISVQVQKLISKQNSSIFKFTDGFSCKELWDKVNGKRKCFTDNSFKFNAEELNEHFCSVSQDPDYELPSLKLSCDAEFLNNNIQPWTVHKLLSSLKATASGIDELPYWFLKIGALYFSEPVTKLYNLSIKSMTVPLQWKTAVISPINKVTNPSSCSDFRPISLTPILSRLLEKMLVKTFFYPLLEQSPLADLLRDQSAFRPTGSTTGAMILLLDKVTNLLQTNAYVQVFALDFSKAFDSISHKPLLQKLAKTGLTDQIYNWYCSFLSGRGHITKFNGVSSTYKEIHASVVQGSALGPVAYIINASDLQPLTNGNFILKYADDTYLIVPSSNSHTVDRELSNISTWAQQHNLKLNLNKSKDIIFRKKTTSNNPIPPPTQNITRVSSLNILGVIFDQFLNFNEHIDTVSATCSQSLYALKILKAKGLVGQGLHAVAQAYLCNRLTYASPAWWGFASLSGKQKLQATLNKATRWGLDGGLKFKTLSESVNNMETKLFKAIVSNKSHILHQLLPPVRQTIYNLRPRPHNYELPSGNALFCKNFFPRMLHY